MTEALTREEVVLRGEKIYDTHLREKVESPSNIGKVIVIDVLSGHYEIDADHLVAVDRAMAQFPTAVLFATRVGWPALGYMRHWTFMVTEIPVSA